MNEKLINNKENFEKLLQTLQCQFLSCFPVNNIKWEKIPLNLTWEQQEIILKNTCGHQLNKLQPIKLDYQLNFLKRLIQVLERNCDGEVHDDIYNEFCKIQQLSANSTNQNPNTEDYIYKHYLLPKLNVQLTMRETRSFVGKGTTGLCTWPAALALADFLLHNEAYVKNKKVLELGAGTGLCGMILTRCKATHVTALTDGSMECIELMRFNIQKNFQAAKEEVETGFFKINDSAQYLGAFHLSWEHVKDFQFNEKLMPDLILAADVVYDDALFKDLLNAIDFIFDKTAKKTKMLLAATVRNEETLEEFLEMVSVNYSVKDCKVVPENDSYIQWDRATIVRILEITWKINEMPS